MAHEDRALVFRGLFLLAVIGSLVTFVLALMFWRPEHKNAASETPPEAYLPSVVAPNLAAFPAGVSWHAVYMLNSTAHWMPLINGYSDYFPPDFRESVETLKGFPSAESFKILQSSRPRYAVFHMMAMQIAAVARCGSVSHATGSTPTRVSRSLTMPCLYSKNQRKIRPAKTSGSAHGSNSPSRTGH